MEQSSRYTTTTQLSTAVDGRGEGAMAPQTMDKKIKTQLPHSINQSIFKLALGSDVSLLTRVNKVQGPPKV